MLNNIKQLLKKTFLYRIYRWLLRQEGKWFPALKAKREYKKIFRKKLNLHNPQLFTEKINWLKLYYYPNDHLAILAGDKWGLHSFLEMKGLAEIASPILYAFDSVEEICWKSLPNKFVIKKSNASAFNIVIRDKEKADELEVINTVKRWMKIPFGYQAGEHHYEKMQPKIIIEKYIEDVGKEWRLWCINGKPEILMTVHWNEEDQTNIKVGHLKRGLIYSNLEGVILDVRDHDIDEVKKSYVVGEKLELPIDLSEMIELSKVLSEGFPFVRVDFFHGEGRLILGELTFTAAGGFGKYIQSIEEEFGEKLILPRLK